MNSLNLKRQAIIDHLVKYTDTIIDKSKDGEFLTFIEHYYNNFSVDDISKVSNENLFGAALSHWRIAQKRQKNEDKINIFNPSIESSGWHCPHTVIHIVIDDLPFLVDSLKMELSRLGCNLRLVANLAGLKVLRNSSGEMRKINGKLGDNEERVKSQQ